MFPTEGRKMRIGWEWEKNLSRLNGKKQKLVGDDRNMSPDQNEKNTNRAELNKIEIYK